MEGFSEPLREKYRNVILSFLDGDDSSRFEGRTEEGNVWVANHGACQTLVIEPDRTSQYEVAVRLPADEPRKKWGGFYVNGNKLSPYRMQGLGSGHMKSPVDDAHKMAVSFIKDDQLFREAYNKRFVNVLHHWGAQSLWLWDIPEAYCIAVRVALPDEEGRLWGGYFVSNGFLIGIGMDH
jgi:hypothetical protein